MSYQKIANVIKRLAEQTAAGRVEWSEAEDEDAFQTSFPNYSVVISKRQIPEEEYSRTLYLVQIFNAEGKVIEEVTDSDFHHTDGMFDRMEDMYDTARRSVLGVEKALDEILGELKDDSDLPF